MTITNKVIDLKAEMFTKVLKASKTNGLKHQLHCVVPLEIIIIYLPKLC